MLAAASSLASQAGLILGGCGLASLVIGLLFVVIGRTVERRRSEFDARATPVSAEVVENVWHSAGGSASASMTPLAFPVLRYRLPDGTVVEHESFEGRSPPVARPGTTVSALYDPADPRLVRVSGASFLPAAFMVIGGIFAAMGALMVAGAIVLLLS